METTLKLTTPVNFATLTITSYTPYKTDDVDPDDVDTTKQTGQNRSKPYDGLLMVFCWLSNSSGFKNQNF